MLLSLTKVSDENYHAKKRSIWGNVLKVKIRYLHPPLQFLHTYFLIILHHLRNRDQQSNVQRYEKTELAKASKNVQE